MNLRKRHANAIVFITGLACLGAAACVQDGHNGGATVTPGFALFYMDEGATAKLAYGAPNSDDVGLMMECKKGSHAIDVSDVARSGAAPTMTLASAGRAEKLAGTPSTGDEAAVLVAHTRSDAPPLQSFKQSGRIDVAYAGQSYAIAANAQERAGVRRFFEACDRGV